MNGNISDEMLMAFVDGEADAESARKIRHAMAHDPALARRAELFGQSRNMLREAYGDVHRDPVPARLASAALGTRETVKRAGNIRRPPAAKAGWRLPLAASVIFGIAGYLVGQIGDRAPSDARATLARALGETASGESRAFALEGQSAQLRTTGAFRVADGVCRSFAVSGEMPAMTGLGCNRGRGWTVELTAIAGESGTYALASDAARQSVDAYLDAIGASAPLTADEEAQLTGKN